MTYFRIQSPTVPPTLSPRLGQLAIGDTVPIHTPHYIPLTSRGALPHLSHDVVQSHTAVRSVYVGLEDFIERHARLGGPPIYKATAEAHGSALRKFISAPNDFLLIMGARRFPAIACSSPNTRTSVSILTSVGFRQLHIEEYTEAIQKLRPDIAIGMTDLVIGRPPGRKRKEKMVDRTHAHTVYTTEKLFSSSDEGREGHTERQKQPAFFAPILPLENTQQSLYLAELEAELRSHVSGLALYEPASLSVVPETLGSLPRLLFSESLTPHDVLEEISLGADLLALPFLAAASDAGMALDFAFPPLSRSLEAEGIHYPLAIDLWSSAYATDLSPLSENCPCYTCQSHHRAYLNHLLLAKEMLAWTLLQIHNHHVMDSFFSGIRRVLEGGSETFREAVKTFHKVYAPTLPNPTGEGPRLRGYQLPVVKGPGKASRYAKVFNRLDDAFDKFAAPKSLLETPDAG